MSASSETCRSRNCPSIVCACQGMCRRWKSPAGDARLLNINFTCAVQREAPGKRWENSRGIVYSRFVTVTKLLANRRAALPAAERANIRAAAVHELGLRIVARE